MKELIIKELHQIEAEQDVKILYACESGSRAWGFPSANSDYDVRFIYLHSQEWYLSIDLEKKRDVIERPITDDLDISGWDLRKSLQLFRRSNPPLMEWLGSPIVYWEQFTVAEQMRQLMPSFYNRKALSYHYWHMAKGNFRDYLQGDTVWVKKYFYVLRPLLAMQWLEKDLGLVPTEFQTMVEKVGLEPSLKAAIYRLIEEKKMGSELDRGPRIDTISEFIEAEMARYGELTFDYDLPKVQLEQLNTLYRNALNEVY